MSGLVAAVAFCATAALGGPIQLVKDINPGVGPGYRPFNSVTLGNLAFAPFCVDRRGCEAYITDGTQAGTRLLVDLTPTPSGSSNARHFLKLGNKVHFFAARNLMVTDGTPQGTFVAVPQVDADAAPVVSGSLMYFTGGDKLWRSDGTTAGTASLLDKVPGDGESPIAVRGTDLFFARTAASGRAELFKYGGAPGSEMQLTTGGASLDQPKGLRTLGSLILFTRRGPSNPGSSLWVSDGTPGGTILLADLHAQQPAPEIHVAGDRAYFMRDGDVWMTNGTVAGTTVTTNFGSGPVLAAAMGQAIYVHTSSGTLTKYEGGLKTPLIFQVGGTLGSFVASGDALYFRREAYGPVPAAIWRTDGTAAGTAIVVADPDLQPIGVIGNRLLLTNGEIAWASDGTAQGTEPIRVAKGQPSNDGGDCANGTAKFGNHMYFAANDGMHGCELWKTDGTEAGTVLVKDILPGRASPFPYNHALGFKSAGPYLYFAATTPDSGNELWRTDGTESGTVLVKDINPGPGDSDPVNLEAMGDMLYFGALAASNGVELWRTDGSGAGTQLVKDINPGGAHGSPRNLKAGTSLLYFAANQPAGIVSLWRSDGTAAGTSQLATHDSPSMAQKLTVTRGDEVFFLRDLDPSGTELWRSDGTVAGTSMVIDLLPGAGSGATELIGTAGGQVFFNGTDGTSAGLWRTDGTQAGTVFVKASTAGFPIFNDRGRLYFYASGSYRTDGLTIQSLVGGPFYNRAPVDGGVYFTGSSVAHGKELWFGPDPPGTFAFPVEDFAPGIDDMPNAEDAISLGPVAMEDRVVFVTRSTSGWEVFGVDYDRTPENFTFPARTAVRPGTMAVSTPVRVVGITIRMTATATDGDLCVAASHTSCGCAEGDWAAAKTVLESQYLCARHVTPLAGNAATTTTVTLGTVSAQFKSTTSAMPSLLSFAASRYDVEEAGTVDVIVNRSGNLSGAVTARWETRNGSATAGSDFGSPNVSQLVSGVVSWASGDSTPKVITIGGLRAPLRLIEDGVLDAGEDFSIVLASFSGNAFAGETPETRIVVADNPPSIQFAQPGVQAPEGLDFAVLVLRRNGRANQPATVRWSTAPASANAGRDYTTRTGTVTWPANDIAPKTILVPILQDALHEGPETFFVALDSPSAGFVLGDPSTAVVTIIDDEIPTQSEISFAAPKVVVLENAGNAVLMLRRTQVSSEFSVPTFVNYETVADTAKVTSDFTISSGTVMWGYTDFEDKAISIPIRNDAVFEAHEAFRVRLSGASRGAAITSTDATVVIVDDDDAFPRFGALPQHWIVPEIAANGWHASNDAGAYEGVFSLRSDMIDDGQSAQVEVTRVFAAGNITFRVKVSSEPHFDKLRVFLDGVEKGSWSGVANTGWQIASIPVSAGQHTVRWSYEKDGSASAGQDAAWIDAVVLP